MLLTSAIVQRTVFLILMRAKSIIFWSLVSTGIVAYLHVILYSMGIPYLKLISPFFSTQDLFADYIKQIGSYAQLSSINVETWLPGWWREIFVSYLSNNPYSSDPELATQTLTHFHSPPLVVIIAKSIADNLFIYPGVVTSYFIIISLIIVLTGFVVSLCFNEARLRLVITPAILLLYPCVFAFTRGNIYAMLSSLSVVAAFLLVCKRPGYMLLGTILMCVAIGLRPNNLLFLPIHCILYRRLYRDISPALYVLLFRSVLILIGSVMVSNLAASILDPDFSIPLFLKGYSYYQSMYEYGGGAIDYSSSLFQPIKLITLFLVRISAPFISPSLLPILKFIILVLGISICVYAWRYMMHRNSNIPRALLVCSVGMIIFTPVFADYHLTILLLPILVAAFWEQDSGPLDEVLLKKASLPFVDSLAVIILLIPKSFPLLPLQITAQTFINPTVMLVYIAWLFLQGFTKSSLRSPSNSKQ